LELRIAGHLREIEQANDDVFGHRQGLHPAITAYEKTLKSVGDCATKEEVDEIAAHVKNMIRREESRPTNQDLRRRARRVVSQAGYPADDYLNAA
jgi:hypothetical protein